MILEWHSTEDKLPGIGRDILKYDANTDDIALGFVSRIETNLQKWTDFHSPVTHWAYIDISSIVSESNTEQKAAMQMGRVFEEGREKRIREALGVIYHDLKQVSDNVEVLFYELEDKKKQINKRQER